MSSPQLTAIGLVGAEGALGRAIIEAAAERGVRVGLEATRQGWVEMAPPQVLLNVASREALAACADFCRRRNVPYVEGCSALRSQDLTSLEQLACHVPVLRAENFSLGHELQRRLLQQLAADGCGELAILERHPRRKKDRPSATAQLLADIWQRARGSPPVEVASYRAGPAVGDHRASLTLDGEEIVVEHRVSDRRPAAAGALAAAQWILGQSPALWQMSDVYRASTAARAISRR